MSWQWGWTRVLVGLVAPVSAAATPNGLGEAPAGLVHEGWVPLAVARRGAEAGQLQLDHGIREEPDGAWVRVRGTPSGFGGYDHAPPPAAPEGYRRPDDPDPWWMRADGAVVLGTSREGRPIRAVWFGAPPSTGAPVVRVLSAHHGDEGSSWELALDLVDALGRDDPQVASLRQGRTIWVVPYVNPDGAQHHTRENAGGVDLNRNYDLEWREGRTAGSHPLSEPETRAVDAWAQLVRPAVSLSLHSGAENLGWVWNHTTEPAADAVGLERWAEAYRDALGDPAFWLTNGAAWYVTHGDTNDWAYGRHGSWDFTLELSNRKSPPVEELDDLLGPHLDAVLDRLGAPLEVVRVVDAATGQPVAAEVRAGEGQPRWTDPVDGVTALPEAATSVRAWAPGYREAVVDADGIVRLVAASVQGDEPVLALLDASLPALPGTGPWTARQTTRVVELRAGDAPPGPGPWWLEDATGRVWPHGLVVGDRRGGELADGARAFVAGAPALQEVGLSIGDAHVAWSAGEWVLLQDASPSSLSMVDESLRIRGAACASAPRSGHLWVLVLSIMGVRTRRQG